MASSGTHLHRDCNAMGDPAKTSLCVPSTCTQNDILLLLIILIIPSCQISVAIDNPSLVPSVSCLTTGSYHWNDMCAADDVFHAEYMQSNCCRWFAHLYIFRDGIPGTRISQYCGQLQGNPVLNESSILVQKLDFE